MKRKKSDDGSGGRKKNTRRGKKTSPSMGTLKAIAQVSHLNGLSGVHFDDVYDNHKRRCPNAVAADSAENRLLTPEQVSAIEAEFAAESLTEAFFGGVGARPDLVSNYWFGNAGAGNVSIADGHPGTAVRMPGPAWENLIMLADSVRHEWVDKGGKARPSKALAAARKKAKAVGDDISTAVPEKMSGQLHKIYARIPPWVAIAAGKDLNPDDLAKAVEEVAVKFFEETGKRVLAANVHRESEHDLHIHLIYTDIVESEIEVDAHPKSSASKILTNQRKLATANLQADGIVKPNRKQKQEELERLWQSGELHDPSAKRKERYYKREILPKGSRPHLISMGPSFVSKTNLWEVSGRSEEVADVNEQTGHHFTFEKRVIEAATREIGPHVSEGPESVYIDYWLSRAWTDAVTGRLSDAATEMAADEAKASVARYVDSGRSLPEPFSEKDLELRSRKIQEAEDARAAAVLAEEKARRAEEAARKAEVAAFTKMQDALEPPALEDVAGKMGYKISSEHEGLIRPTEGPFPEEVIVSGRTFSHEFSGHPQGKVRDGSGAVELLATDDIHKTEKRSKLELLGQLLKWFPSRAVGLLREALGPGGSKLVEQMLNIDKAPAKAPAKKSSAMKISPPEENL